MTICRWTVAIIISITAAAVLASYSFASPPVPPPAQQGRISTTTEINCVGDVIVTQSYKNTYVSDGVLVSPAGSGSAGTDNAVINAYLDALEDADFRNVNPGSNGAGDSNNGGDSDVSAANEIGAIGTVPGSDGQSWRDIAGYPGWGLAANEFAQGANGISRAFELAGGIGAEGDFGSLPDVNGGLGRGDSIAEIGYEYKLEAINGTTELRKTFTATDADTPNLEVSQDIAYQADSNSNIASAEMEETVAMTVVSYGTSDIGGALTGASALCPWVQHGASASGLPATNELVAGGSSFDATLIVAETDAAVTTTDVPSFYYSIDAAGPTDLGGVGIGTISAAFAVQIQEGGGPYVPPTTRTVYVNALGETVPYAPTDPEFMEQVFEGHIVPVTVTLPGTGIPALAKFEQYQELASAAGVWTFHKDMSYNAILPAAGGPTAGSIVGGLLH